MLDQDPDQWSDGDVLPRGWQFILLGADTRRSALRQDGFPGLGVPLPDVGLSRLLLGGSTVRYHSHIHVGAALHRESRVQKQTRKETANGPMTIVTLGTRALYDRSGAPRPRGDADLYPAERSARRQESHGGVARLLCWNSRPRAVASKKHQAELPKNRMRRTSDGRFPECGQR
jgi:3-methylfumaryl-CoA hydratase